MGSGCSSNPTWFQNKVADGGVAYTGPAIPALGICTNDTLKEVEAVVLGKIIDYSTGVGIHIPNIDLTDCGLFTQYITCCSTCDELDCLMAIVFNSLCLLYTDLETLKGEVDTLLNGPYNTACLSLSANPTLNQIIQELIKEFCALKSSFDTLQTAVSGITSSLSTNIGNFLLNAITTCQGTSGPIKSGTGATASIAFNGYPPIGSVMEYNGPMNVFDNTGLGLSNTSACGWALCNGNNGTQDKRGFVSVCAINGMGGGALDPIVDPSLHPATPTSNYSIGSTGGEISHTLTTSQIPAVSISGSTTATTISTHLNNINDSRFKFGPDDHAFVFPPQGSTRGADVTFNIPAISLTGSTSGGGQAHENRMPYKAIAYIQRVA